MNYRVFPHIFHKNFEILKNDTNEKFKSLANEFDEKFDNIIKDVESKEEDIDKIIESVDINKTYPMEDNLKDDDGITETIKKLDKAKKKKTFKQKYTTTKQKNGVFRCTCVFDTVLDDKGKPKKLVCLGKTKKEAEEKMDTKLKKFE